MDIEIKIPDIGIDQAEVIDILVKLNDIVQKEQGLIVIEGDKASMEIPSLYHGKIKEIKVKVTDIVKQDSVIMVMEVIKDIKINKEDFRNDMDCVIINSKIHASPLIRRLARSLKIDLNKITGSGRKKRIIKKDIDNHIIKINDSTENILKTSSDENFHDVTCNQFGNVKKIKLNKIKKSSGNVLFKNWSTIPHVTQFDEVDITDLEEFRIQYNKKYKLTTKNKKLTLLTFIIKAISKGLEKFPLFNSEISHDYDILFLKQYINIGIAVDTEHGLFVPVIKDIMNKTLSDIADEIYHKSNDARNGKLKISDLKGGCFTISSLGNIGGTTFTPIINASEAAILGVSKYCYKPIWNGSAFIPRLMLPLSLSYNHRIIDGAEGARFISFINMILSDIRLLLV